MAYLPDIPQGTDNLSTSQGQLLANFTAIDTGTSNSGFGFSRNHITMTDSTNGGLHSRVDFYQSVADPTISGFASSLYPKTESGATALFYRNAGGILKMTNSVTTGTNSSGNTEYTIITPFGLTLKFGVGSASFSGVTNNFATAFSSACHGVVVSARTTPSSAYAATSGVPSASGFSGFLTSSGPGTQAIHYFAWGV